MRATASYLVAPCAAYSRPLRSLRGLLGAGSSAACLGLLATLTKNTEFAPGHGNKRKSQLTDSPRVCFTGPMNSETFSFQAETKQLLQLMIHSVYSNKEVFLRELISNASDALDKLRFESLTRPELTSSDAERGVELELDATARTLTISDNGIGMNREEVIRNIGTIARSGTQELIEKLKQSGNADAPTLIGQFGIGFYAAFIAADRVTLVTRRAGEDSATRWESKGDGEYTLEAGERASHGTSVTLHLKAVDAEDGLEDFTNPAIVRQTVKKYSDFVTYPVRIKGESEPLNSMRPIWNRSQSEVKDEEYAEFYRHVSHDWNEPAKVIAFQAEGAFTYQALMFIPSKAPFDLFYRDAERGLQLYVKKILIMDRCEELLPQYLRFVRGVVDANDLPLNMSREVLQQNRQLVQIRKRLTKKVIDTLSQWLEVERDKYLSFWEDFGTLVKEGITSDGDNRDKLSQLLLFHSTHDAEALTTLPEYVARMSAEQTEIYFIAGDALSVVQNSPHIEAFRAQGREVLLFVEPVDEFVTRSLDAFDGKKFKSVAKGVVDLNTDKKEGDTAEADKLYEPLLRRLEEPLKQDISSIRLSKRLTSSPACLVGEDDDLSPHLERLLKQQHKDVPKQKRILEINPDHPLAPAMNRLFQAAATDTLLDDYARLLYGQALLAEGSPLPDPVAFGKLLADLMVRAV